MVNIVVAVSQMAAKKGATVMYLYTKLREASPAPRQSWLGIIVHLLVEWVG
jgi:argininosuccinate lyase